MTILIQSSIIPSEFDQWSDTMEETIPLFPLCKYTNQTPVRIIPYLLSQIVVHSNYGAGVVCDLNRNQHRIRVEYVRSHEILEHCIEDPLLTPMYQDGQPMLHTDDPVSIPFRPSDVIFHKLNGLGVVVDVDPHRRTVRLHFFRAPAPSGLFHMDVLVEEQLMNVVSRENQVVRATLL